MPGTVVFRSARAVWFAVASFLSPAIAIFLLFTDPWFLALLFLPVIVITLPIYFRTSYTIHDMNQLTVVCGLLYNKTFNIHDIRSIRPSNNPVSSPALSLNRLELIFSNKEILLISPAQQELFIAALLAINHEIEVKKPSLPGKKNSH